MNDHRDTIFALSSGQPPAAIAVIRISGPRAGDALRALSGRIPPPRMATLAKLRDPQSGEILDEALTLWFPGPNSETGEDSAELQIHGGRAIISAVLGALGGIEGVRLAKGGEFTRRAFENGKIDLTRAEGLADLIAAETEAQRRQAFGQARGALAERAEAWRDQLTRALALAEAAIDFADEGDIPADVARQVRPIVERLRVEMSAALADSERGERVRDGMVVAIAGPPNAGKSTLMNALARRDVAIVSPHAGTTRDVIELHLDLGGMPVTLLDTAGLRDAENPVEQEGVRRARARVEQADLVLWLTEIGDESEFSIRPTPGQQVWKVGTKIDLYSKTSESKDYNFQISATSGIGIQLLIDSLSQAAYAYSSGEPALVARARQREELASAIAALTTDRPGGEEILAEQLRACATALGRLTGRIDVEDVLEVIFREFCVGK